MTTKEKLVWRLGKLPTPEEIISLVKDKVITQEEARDILFSKEVKEADRDIESFKSEIKFLRELVEKLSNHKPDTIIRYIEQIRPVYIHQPWITPYTTYCSAGGTMYVQGASGSSGSSGAMNIANAIGGASSTAGAVATNCAFTAISTF